MTDPTEEQQRTAQSRSAVKAAGPSILPGSDGEHTLQETYGSMDRSIAFYNAQVLRYLSPLMQEFISRQEVLVVGTADRKGECDCTSKFGTPGFICVLNDKMQKIAQPHTSFLLYAGEIKHWGKRQVRATEQGDSSDSQYGLLPQTPNSHLLQLQVASSFV